jgi:hypothetical protein
MIQLPDALCQEVAAVLNYTSQKVRDPRQKAFHDKDNSILFQLLGVAFATLLHHPR